MRNTQENIAKVKVGTVIQIDPEASETVPGRGSFAVVAVKETWGVVADLLWPGHDAHPSFWGKVRVTWGDMEIIGSAAWGSDGKRLTAVEPLRHHP